MKHENIPTTIFNLSIYLLTPYKIQIYILLSLAVLSGSYGTISSYLTKLLIDQVANADLEGGNLLKMSLCPAILLAINYEIHNLVWRSINFINLKLSPKIKNHIMQKMFGHAHKHSYKFFQENPSGAIANNINIMADNIEDVVHHLFPFVIRGLTQLMFALVSMYFVHPVFTITLFVWVFCFSIISVLYSRKIKLLSKNYAENRSALSGKLIDSILNVSNVRLFAKERFEGAYLKVYLKNAARTFFSKEWFSIKLLWCQGLSITCLIVLMTFFLIRLKAENVVTIGDFAFILGLVLYITENVWYLTEQADKLNDVIGQCNQSIDIIFKPHNVRDIPNAKQLIVVKGDIEFSNVTFGYDECNPIFKNNSVLISGGQKVGLVGFSGSGKTTFINLIVRLFDLTSGQIKIDGQDISQVAQNSLRENIGFIPQDCTLFNRSLMENIRYGQINATDEEVIMAAKKASAHEFIISTPNGYNTMVGERGIKLSGGQRQRISIARAILKNAPILILDEATSALDSVTERYIQNRLFTFIESKTVIVVAHRLSTLLNMDRILVLERGKIVEDGTHTELLRINNLYATLWKHQMNGFLADTNTLQDIVEVYETVE